MNEQNSLLPHQQRVVDEREQLHERLTKLRNFIDDPEFSGRCDSAERERLIRQRNIMHEYWIVLGERIDAFQPPSG